MIASSLIVGVGDIHGRFQRVQRWLEALEAALGRKLDAVLAVGDVEAFTTADDHRRKAAKRTMPAEFSAYARGEARLGRPFHFIGGNNEDFETLHRMQQGGEVVPDVHYLGRVGTGTVAGLRLAWLSGIHAPKWFETALQPPESATTRKQAGYFRAGEVEQLAGAGAVELLLVHEWPRGLFARTPGKPVRPWMGNPITRGLIDTLRPKWLLCGHSHERFAASLHHPGGGLTRVACLDEAAEPEGALLWMEWEQGEAVRVGWGIEGRVDWRRGEPWGAVRGTGARLVESDGSP
jgi:lariat debranching enzyme